MARKIIRPEDRVKIRSRLRSMRYRWAKRVDPEGVKAFEAYANDRRRKE